VPAELEDAALEIEMWPIVILASLLSAPGPLTRLVISH
jgi:hypothetical protein